MTLLDRVESIDLQSNYIDLKLLGLFIPDGIKLSDRGSVKENLMGQLVFYIEWSNY